jgi:hypothetical protein
MEQKLSYYQKNRDKILEKRRLQREFEREERLRLGRPFMKFDDCEISIEPLLESQSDPVAVQVNEPVAEKVAKPVKKVTKKSTKKDAEPIIEPVGKVIEKEKKTRKRVVV